MEATSREPSDTYYARCVTIQNASCGMLTRHALYVSLLDRWAMRRSKGARSAPEDSSIYIYICCRCLFFVVVCCLCVCLFVVAVVCVVLVFMLCF